MSPEFFEIAAATLNRLNSRPVVLIAGDKTQQQPLRTVDGRVDTTRSIINDGTLTADNSVHHSLYQQFRVVDKDYAAFLDILRYLQPTQEQLDEFQRGIVLCSSGILSDQQIYEAHSKTADTVITTVSRAAAQRVNQMVVDKLFAGQAPLSQIPCTSVANGRNIFPY